MIEPVSHIEDDVAIISDGKRIMIRNLKELKDVEVSYPSFAKCLKEVNRRITAALAADKMQSLANKCPQNVEEPVNEAS